MSCALAVLFSLLAPGAGQFFNGKFEGVGTLKKKDGTVLKGTWRMGWRVSK